MCLRLNDDWWLLRKVYLTQFTFHNVDNLDPYKKVRVWKAFLTILFNANIDLHFRGKVVSTGRTWNTFLAFRFWPWNLAPLIQEEGGIRELTSPDQKPSYPGSPFISGRILRRQGKQKQHFSIQSTVISVQSGRVVRSISFTITLQCWIDATWLLLGTCLLFGSWHFLK